jgi:hypothetical protein
MSVHPKQRPDDRRGAKPGTTTMQLEHGGSIGQAPFIATDEQRRDVMAWVKAGLTQDDCAALLEIHVATFKRHFRREWKMERIKVKLAIANRLTRMALAGDKTCMIFWLRTQAKWNTRVEHVGPDGAALKLIDLGPYLGKLEDGQLDLLEPLLEQLLAEGGNGIDFRDQIGAGATEIGEGEAGD